VTKRFTHIALLVMGIAIGGAVMRILTPVPAAAQMSMHGESCEQMHAAMEKKMRSAADRAYMQSMTSMHDAMATAKVTGNADHDFLVMMIPHHEAAVQMAKAELQYGKDAKVRTLAQQIISAQEKEIAEMTSWLKSMP
jgi:uncharacterized protein (DUF305 family)